MGDGRHKEKSTMLDQSHKGFWKARRVWLSPRLGPSELELKDYLSHSIIDPVAESELRGYLETSFRRLLLTLSLVPEGRGAILELGANPYFFTLLLKRYRGYDVHLANYFGHGKEGLQEVRNEKYGELHRLHYKEFNVEEDKFPYESDTFDGVMFCELLEHLIQDPIGTFAEIHRILKPGGWLVLTTPNALRRHNLIGLLRGQNLYDPYSGYGPYGRHNREYTAPELDELLRESGFVVEQLKTRDLHPDNLLSRFLALLLGPLSGYNLFCRARKGAQFRWHYPPWLFRSGHPRRRVEKPYVRMGVNDPVQLGDGWWELERVGESPRHFRWTKKRAELYVLASGGERHLQLHLLGDPAHRAPERFVHLTVAPPDGSEPFERRHLTVPRGEWTTVEITLSKPVPAGEILVVLEVDRTFVPNGEGTSRDGRALGIAIRSLELAA
jgi:SAM-dependent methyltransferase